MLLPSARDDTRDRLVELAGVALTIGTQIHRQWRARTSDGVSPWLFVGQTIASTGFSIYSALVGDWVFIVTNSLMAASATLGLAIVLHHRRTEHARSMCGPSPKAKGAAAAKLASARG